MESHKRVPKQLCISSPRHIFDKVYIVCLLKPTVLLALELISKEPPYRSASIALDNVAAIQATSLTKSTPGSYLVDSIREAAESTFIHRGRAPLTLRWVPGHVEIEGNERSDEEAKRAARGESSEEQDLPRATRGQLPFSRSAARQRFNEGLKERWKKTLELSKRWPKLHQIDAMAPSNRFRKIARLLPRRHTSILTQLRTGHVPLQRHLHHIRPDEFENPNCPACGQCEETVSHFLLQYQNYADSRHRLEQAVGRASRDLPKLLSNPKMFKHLFVFINETQRFREMFGDLSLPTTSKKGFG